MEALKFEKHCCECNSFRNGKINFLIDLAFMTQNGNFEVFIIFHAYINFEPEGV